MKSLPIKSGFAQLVFLACCFWGANVALANQVLLWGANVYGQNNIPMDLTNVVALGAGGYHTLALKPDGTVVAWGDSRYGQTNVPAGLNNVRAVAAGLNFSLALMAD